MSDLDLDALEALCRDCEVARALKEEADAAWLRMKRSRPRGQQHVSPEEQAAASETVEADCALDRALDAIAVDESTLLALITRLRAAEARTAWQPIETAPRGLVLVLLDGGLRVLAMRTSEGEWRTARRAVHPLAWAALPAPPASEVPRG